MCEHRLPSPFSFSTSSIPSRLRLSVRQSSASRNVRCRAGRPTSRAHIRRRSLSDQSPPPQLTGICPEKVSRRRGTAWAELCTGLCQSPCRSYRYRDYAQARGPVRVHHEDRAVGRENCVGSSTSGQQSHPFPIPPRPGNLRYPPWGSSVHLPCLFRYWSGVTLRQSLVSSSVLLREHGRVQVPRQAAHLLDSNKRIFPLRRLSTPSYQRYTTARRPWENDSGKQARRVPTC